MSNTGPDVVEVNIERLGINAEGVGHTSGLTLFVPGALPGERVKVGIRERKKTYGRGVLFERFSDHPKRVLPECPIYEKCGGCQLMHADYSFQLEYKSQRVKEALERIGKIKDPGVEPCLPSPQITRYRNKIQLPVRQSKAGKGEVGFFKAGTHQVVPISDCLVHCEAGGEILTGITETLKKIPIPPYHEASHRGQLRHILIRTSDSQKQVLIIFVTRHAKAPGIGKIAEVLIKKFPLVAGVVQNVNPERGNTILGDRFITHGGRDFLTEKAFGLTFRVSVSSFFQVNTFQVEALCREVLSACALSGSERVIDAYCGVGLFTLVLARQAQQVVGLESVGAALGDAEENAKKNGISNVTFVRGRVESKISSVGDADVVVLDPPRKGCGPGVLKGAARCRPKRIVYVSCDPATLARDLNQLMGSGYRVERVQPIDMFPQTAHVECVVTLIRANS